MITAGSAMPTASRAAVFGSSRAGPRPGHGVLIRVAKAARPATIAAPRSGLPSARLSREGPDRRRRRLVELPVSASGTPRSGGRSPRGEGASAVARTVGSWGVARADGARVVPAQSGGSPSGGDHATGRDGVRRTGSPEPTVAIPAGSLRPRVRRRQPGPAAWRSPLWRPQSSPRRRQPVASQRPGAPGPDAAPVGPPARSGPTPAGSGGKVHPRCPPSTHPTGSRRGSARLGPGRRHTGGTAIPPPERPAGGAARAARPRARATRARPLGGVPARPRRALSRGGRSSSSPRRGAAASARSARTSGGTSPCPT
ncbi:MAG: hypothetical protein QOC93_2699 [Actinomycetota bacterium]|nr:hypothetical protein [Actinomycetota bacterium]